MTDYIRDSNVSIGADRFDMAQGARHGMAGRMTQTPPVEPETQACEALEAEAEAAGKTMAYEGFPRSVPAAFRRFATAWLTGYDAAARPNGRDRQA